MTVTIPSTIPLGTYYLLACADDTVVVVDGGAASGVAPFAERGDVTILERGRRCQGEGSRPCLRLDVCADELAVLGDVREVVARPDAMAVSEAELCARRLAPYRSAADRLPTSAPGADWAQLTGIGDPWAMQPETIWRQRKPDNRLRVAIGVAADGSAVELDLKEAAENGMGPHGLCVGATGSGKSDLYL